MLKQIVSSGFDAIGEWRRMWNGEVLPFLRSQQLIAGPGVRLDRRPGGTTIRAAAGVTCGGAAYIPSAPEPYNSYFKITMVRRNTLSYAVTVADGATGSDSYAVVNGGSTYTLPPYSETISSGALYLLKYTPAQYNSGGYLVSSAAMAISSIRQSGGTFPTLPSGGTGGAYYYQLGRVIWSSGSVATQVVQDHTTGVVYFNWYINCNQYAQ